MTENQMRKESKELYEHVNRFLETLEPFYQRLRGMLNERGNEYDIKQIFHNIEEILDVVREQSSVQTTLEENIETFLANWFFISSHQKTPLECQLPYHDNPPQLRPHVLYKGYICQKNPSHVFCRKHKLSACVVCGGDLK